MTSTANPGYALAQLEKALAAAGQAGASARESTAKKVDRWRQVLQGIFSGSLTVGSRAPVAGVPAWATLEVAHGGFATGNLLAGGPLQPHEVELLRTIDAPPGKERAALNTHFLSDEGRAALLGMLSSGCYRINVPEEGALLVVAWLLARGRTERATKLIDEIVAFTDRLRFYPVPDARPLLPSAVVKLHSTSEVARTLEAGRPNRHVEKMNEALAVWAPLRDRAVSLFLETVEGDTPHLREDPTGTLARRPDGQPIIDGGWPCKLSPGWIDRAKALLHDFSAARARHTLCEKPDNAKSSLGVLRRSLQTCVDTPDKLTDRDVAVLRGALAALVTKHGAPGSEKHAKLRAEQTAMACRITHREAARVLGARLGAYPADAGLSAVEPVLGPISEEELSALASGAPQVASASVAPGAAEGPRNGEGVRRVAAGAAIPASLVRKLDPCLEAPIEDLVQRQVIPSSEVLAIVLPQITSQVRSAGIADPDLARLYGAIYAAFRRRRSLLLLDLQSQVRLEELPWVAAIDEQRTGKLAETVRSRQTLEQVTALAISSFPQTILPNKLLQEMRALVSGADLKLPLVDELAADIFMGQFSGKFVESAKIAARLLTGTLYARYYDLPIDTILRVEDVRKQREEHGAASSAEFAALCTERAKLSDSKGGSWVARNGKIIEQEQILTTHNLAAVLDRLELLPRLRSRFLELSQACFKLVCKRQQIQTKKWHTKLVLVKNSAYAWRQMVFYLSFLPPGEVQTFLAWAGEHLRAQSDDFQKRFAPALHGLSIAASGGDLDKAEREGTARRFLGWAAGRHWLLEET